MDIKTQPNRDYFEADGAPKKCFKFESTTIEEKIVSLIDVYRGMGPTAEAEYSCECGELLGYWEYGCWDPRLIF